MFDIWRDYTVHSKKLERPYPHTPAGILKGIPALIILKRCSKLLEFTTRGDLVGYRMQTLATQDRELRSVRGLNPEFGISPLILAVIHKDYNRGVLESLGRTVSIRGPLNFGFPLMIWSLVFRIPSKGPAYPFDPCTLNPATCRAEIGIRV